MIINGGNSDVNRAVEYGALIGVSIIQNKEYGDIKTYLYKYEGICYIEVWQGIYRIYAGELME